MKKAFFLYCLIFASAVKAAEGFSSSFFDGWSDFDENSFFDPFAPILPENPSFTPEPVDSSFFDMPLSTSSLTAPTLAEERTQPAASSFLHLPLTSAQIQHIQESDNAPCPFCSLLFPNIEALGAHLISEGIKKPYQCTSCDSATSHFSKFNKHQTTPGKCPGAPRHNKEHSLVPLLPQPNYAFASPLLPAAFPPTSQLSLDSIRDLIDISAEENFLTLENEHAPKRPRLQSSQPTHFSNEHPAASYSHLLLREQPSSSHPNSDIAIASTAKARPHTPLSVEEFEETKKSYPAIRCPQCPSSQLSTYPSYKHFEKHMAEQGVKRAYYCKPCNSLYPTQSTFNNHLLALGHKAQALSQQNILHDVVHVSLSLEDFDFITRNRDDLSCPQCKINFSTLADLEQHLFREVGSGIFSCCGKSFSSYNSMRNHQQYKHSQTTPPTLLLSDTARLSEIPNASHFAPPTSLPETAGPPLSPYYQALLLKKIRLLKETLVEQTPDASVACTAPVVHVPFCLEDFDFIKHNEDDLSCPQCLIKLPSIAALERHIFEKTGSAELFSCCGKSFSSYSSMRSHQQYKHSQPTPPALLLNDTARLSEILHSPIAAAQRHAIHKSLIIKCPYCFTTFLNWAQLELHIIAESGNENPYYCDLCTTGVSAGKWTRHTDSKQHRANVEKSRPPQRPAIQSAPAGKPTHPSTLPFTPVPLKPTPTDALLPSTFTPHIDLSQNLPLPLLEDPLLPAEDE